MSQNTTVTAKQNETRTALNGRRGPSQRIPQRHRHSTQSCKGAASPPWLHQPYSTIYKHQRRRGSKCYEQIQFNYFCRLRCIL